MTRRSDIFRLPALLGGAAVVMGLAGCAGPGGNPDTAQSAQCDNGMLCGSYIDGNNDGGIAPDEWNNAFKGADTNGDGQLSPGEFQAAGGSWGGAGGHLGR
ncbi:MAG: hypothetical protein WAS21_20190 [Geminicoccaceae bacterium]